jgi:hypothetical protein
MLPVRRNRTEMEPRLLARAAQAHAETQLAIFRHALAARFQSEADRLDSQAATDAIQASLETELDLLDYGMRRAGGSPAKAVLVARKVEMLSAMNNRRISRRFGG